MKQTFTLIGVTARNILGINRVFHGAQDERRKAAFRLIAFLALFILIGFSLYGMFYSIASALDVIGEAQAVLSMAVVGASILSLFDVFFRTTHVLFSFGDYDIVMSLPVKTGAVVTSRIMSMYAFELLFSGCVMIPAFLAYGSFVSLSVIQIMLFIIMLITVPLIPITVGMIPGVLIGILTSRMKRKNIMNIVFSLLFVAAYMFVYYQFISSDMLENISSETAFSVGASIQTAYPPSMWFSSGLNGSLGHAILFIAAGLLAIALVTWLLTLSFRKLHDIVTAQKTNNNYKLSSVRSSHPFRALYKREWKRYLSSSSYVLNTFFGNVMVLAAGVLAIVFRNDIHSLFDILPAEFTNTLYIAAAFLIASFVTVSTLSSITISIEGKNMWTLMSLPVPAWTVFSAKLFFSMHIGLIVSVLSSVMLIIAFGADVITAAIMLLIPVIFTAASSTFGLYINLLLPKFDWKNEMQVVKQSSSVLIVNVVGMFIGIAAFMVLLIASETDPILFSGIFLAVLTVVTIWMLVSLKAKSQKLMLRLAEK